MNREWARRWISLFADRTDELLTLYADQFEFEDVNLDVRIINNKAALREFFLNFVSANSEESYNRFNVFDYVGDSTLGVVQWTWDAKHAEDFLGMPAAGKETSTRGITMLAFRSGKIVQERAIWDVLPVLRQLDVLPRL